MPNYGTIGQAAIRVVADGSGFEEGLQKQTSTAASKIGAGFGAVLGKTLKVGAVAAGAAVTGVLTLAITKGFQRLVALDQAKVKMNTLGLSAKGVAAAMDTVKAAVKGTAYGLDEGATLATQFMAAGVKGGKALYTQLRDVAGAASITGGSMGEIGMIWTQVAAKGRLQGDEMLQMMQRGIPVLQLLAKHYKVSTAAAGEMVSKGKVSFADFSAAMHTYVGNAAEDSGKTFSGAMANVKASLGRIGQGLLESTFTQLAPLFQKIITALGPLEAGAAKVGTKIGKVFKATIDVLWTWVPTITKVAQAISGLFTLLKKGDYTANLRKSLGWMEDSPVVDAILRIRDGAVSLFGVFDKFASGGDLSKILPGFAGLSLVLGGLTTKLLGFGPASGFLAGFFSKIPIFGKYLTMFASPLGIATIAIGSLIGIMAGSKNGGADFGKMVEDIVAKVGEMASQLAEKIPGIATGIANGLTKAMPKIVGAMTQILPGLVAVLGTTLTTLLPVLIEAAMTLFRGLVIAVRQIAPVLIDAFVLLVKSLIAILPVLLPGLVDAFIGLLDGIVDTVVEIAPLLIAAFMDLINAVVEVLPRIMPVLLTAAVRLFTTLVSAVTTILPQLTKAFVDLILAVVGLVPVLLPQLLDAAVALFTALVNALPKILPPLLDGMVRVILAIVTLLPTLIPQLLDAALRLLDALIQAFPVILPALIKATVILITAMTAYLPKLIPALLDAAVRLFMALINALPIILPVLIKGTMDVVMAVTRLLPTLIPLLLKAAGTLFMALVQAVPGILKALLSAFGTLLGETWKYISGVFADWRTKAAEWFGKIGQAITGVWNNLTSWLKKPIDAALEWIQKNLINKFNELMKNLGISWRIGVLYAPAAIKYDTGGYTGAGPKNKVAGAVHAGEFVIRKSSTSALLRDYGMGFLQALNGYAKGGWVAPVAARVTFPYGARYKDGSKHWGVDYSVPNGTRVVAPYSGKIVKEGWDTSGFGNHLRIAHPNGLFTILGHLMRDVVRVGQWVNQGQYVALSDNTGRSTGPHLHWELRKRLYDLYSAIDPYGMSSDVIASLKDFGANLIRTLMAGVSKAADWLSSLGPMGQFLAGIGRNFLNSLGDKAIASLGLGGGGVGGKVLSFDRGGYLPPGTSIAQNNTGRPEWVGGPQNLTVYLTVSVDDLAKMTKVGDFIEMLERARVQTRRTERSGAVSA